MTKPATKDATATLAAAVSFMADTLSDEPGDIRSYYTIAGGVVF
jgi:hypothetical protein